MAGVDLGIDLGTTKIIVYRRGKGIVLEEPSVVAYNVRSDQVVAVGHEALAMLGKTPAYIQTECPIRDGVISNHLYTEYLVKEFVRKVTKSFLIKPRIAICIPSAITPVEARAVVEAAMSAGARKVYLVDEPLAAAMGAGIDVTAPSGHMMVDCGGGTTDLSSCHFKIQNNRVAYKIDITTAYENGNTDFGGNNLTYRILQLLKIALASFLVSETQTDFHSLIASFEGDLFRNVDEYGLAKVYSLLDQCYQNVEAIIPTRFKDYEHRSRADYYAVKNNFYFLFEVAERIKKAFYEKNDLLRLAVSSTQVNEIATECLLVDKWKLSIQKNGVLSVLKDIPTVYLSIYDLNLLLRADIYGIIKQFLEGPYDSGELDSYQILKLTGQSCKINIFRDALKEFIPGKIIAPSKNRGESEYELKLVCLDGAIKYLKDQKYGYADVKIHHEQAAFPYKITAFTHTGEEVILIQSLDREKIRGFISRNMVDLTLKIYLKDLEGKTRYVYNCACKPEDFEEKQPEQIVARYIGQIRQDDLDDEDDVSETIDEKNTF